MSELVSLSRDNEVAIITVNNPPVNALSPGVPEGIAAAIEAITADAAIQAAVLIGGGRTFIAGADIKEFAKIRAGQKKDIGLSQIIARIEDCPKPVVAAIHGTALGGGLETALGCHYRVAVASAKVGQPEVKLGIIPGAGGTQRLPRLCGIPKAAVLCSVGDPIGAAEALELGIVDAIIEGDLLQGAIAFARARAAAGEAARRTCDLTSRLGDSDANKPALDAARADAARRFRGQRAPLVAIDAVAACATLPFDQGMAYEREEFEKLLKSSQSAAMIHAFFGERAVAKVPGVTKDTRTYDIRRAAVVGAGTMGGGIAMALANAGIPVLLKESSQEALDRGMATIRANYEGSVARGRLSASAAASRLALITPQISYDGFEQADLVIEAVFEGMALKKQVFAELDAICKPDCVLASNTSTLSIDEIASATGRPQMVIGTHFFSPANVMRLLEIVRGAATAPEVIATAMGLARTVKKVGVLVGNCRGFVGNRMFHPYRREAQFLVEEGATPAQVDQALYNFGMAMGPLATGDLAGLDVGWRIRKEYAHLNNPGERQPLVEDALCEAGRYGQKTRAGWYRYDEKRQSSADPAVDAIIEAARAQAGIVPREISAEEITERIIYALVNEGARILEEGFALRSVDIDMIYLTGYGFPVWRGGPMFHASLTGLGVVLERIREFERLHGAHWAPAPLLVRLAEEGRGFESLDG
ncbi:MAG: 3-hydroxyacyl-CoA dehydrogenase [Acidobacteria bacterium]|nr:3-hydroxyacyl-CoA dehydrogenase [Acidobacteriota bacterium]